jgi:glycosyltransferase involved in cell wall biosynthesis
MKPLACRVNSLSKHRTTQGGVEIDECRLPGGAQSHGPALPRLSVITPSFNQARFLDQAIRSVLAQEYPDLEYIVIDGGSNDGTVEILRRYSRRLSFWVSEADRGQSHALNKGLSRCTGDIVFWLNADDVVLSGAFAAVVSAFRDHGRVRIVAGQAKVIDAGGREIGVMKSRFTSWADYASRRCTIRQVATFFDRKLFDELGGVDEGLNYSMDHDLLLRFTRECRPVVIADYVSAYRKHDQTKFDHNSIAGYTESDKMMSRHLSGTGLEQRYLKWSIGNWLKLACKRGFEFSQRIACVSRACSRARELGRPRGG